MILLMVGRTISPLYIKGICSPFDV